MDRPLCRHHVVLLGIGHTNAHIVRSWAMQPLPDTDLTCITDHLNATYSGMLPAVLARQIPISEMEIDLVRLAASAGARVVFSPVKGLDLISRSLLFEDRPKIPFDVLSIGIGSIPSFKGVEVVGDSVVAIKPMQSFLERLEIGIERAQQRCHGELRIAIVGSGVAGVEIACCLPAFLDSARCGPYRLELITRSDSVLPEATPSARRLVEAELSRRSISVALGTAVTAVCHREICLDDGARRQADLVIWATGATAPPLLQRLGLPVDERGFLLTDNTLRSLGDSSVFAVGDTGTIQSEHLPKAGLYAVRQGPILWNNIQRSLSRQTPVKYRPQREFLKLINTGDGRAIGQWRGFAFHGAWVKRLKDRIDGRFVEKYRPKPMLDDGQAMQCRGCGCKLGATPLMEALQASSDNGALLVEDAAQVMPGEDFLASTDFFSCPLDDAFLNGRIAALHSASDLIACGARVTSALANLVVPEGELQAQRRWLSDFLVGARREFAAMQAEIVGGHTIVGPRAEAGFTVFGTLDGSKMLRKSELLDGDQLLLTKPLGSGVLMAAAMRGQCAANDYAELLRNLLVRQHVFVEIAAEMQLQAATDVTGFGLVGHLLEMLESSACSATLRFETIPFMSGAVQLSESGLVSSLFDENFRAASRVAATGDVAEAAAYKLLFDPQTCGGLLIGVRPDRVAELCERFEHHDLPRPAAIGRVHAAKTNERGLRIE